MKLFNIAWLIGILCLSASVAPAQEVSLLPEGEVAIERGKSRTFEFGTLPQAGQIVMLTVTSRLDSTTALGSNFFLKLRLNGRDIEAAKSRDAQRLLNKKINSPITPTLSGQWFGAPRGWRVLYDSGFVQGRNAKFYEGDPYTLVLDVTDLINPAAENRLEITNTADDRAVQASGTEAKLILSSLKVEAKPGQSAMITASSTAVPSALNRGETTSQPQPYRGKVLPGGGFAITVGPRTWKFSSAFSFPNAGFNRLGEVADTTGQPSWKPKVQGDVVTASGPNYSLLRQVRFTPRKVEVSDKLTNTSGVPLGLVVRHETALQGEEGATVRLAGNPDPALTDYYSPGNPSVTVTSDDHTLGLLVEDDVFRNQAHLTASGVQGQQAATIGIKTEMLRLAAGETYTLRWSVYVVKGRDYFDFINLVRQDWGANFTVQGAWYWGYRPDQILAMSDEVLKHQFERLGVHYTTIGGGWIDTTKDLKKIGFGSGVLDPYWDDYRRRIRESAIKLRRAVPGIKVLAYYDTQRDTSDNSATKYADSWLTAPGGAQNFTDWSGAFSRSWSDVATLDNSYGRAMLDTADRYLDEMQLDGLYWDEMENTFFGGPLLTYNASDGHSAQIDPKTYTITSEVGLTTLLGEKHRLEVIRRVKAKNGVVLGNGPATTRAILATGVQRMVEAQHNDSWPFEGHLQTPLGYLGAKMDFADMVRLIRLGLLPVGTRLSYTHDFEKYLFPFTPRELHSGYLLGEERIIATHSGNYGWVGAKNLMQVRHFDRDGHLTATDFPTRMGVEARTQVTLAEGEAVVLERLPITLEGQGSSEISQVKAETTGLRFHLKAPSATKIVFQTGTFPIVNGQNYRVNGMKVRATQGMVVWTTPAHFDGEIRIDQPGALTP